MTWSECLSAMRETLSNVQEPTVYVIAVSEERAARLVAEDKFQRELSEDWRRLHQLCHGTVCYAHICVHPFVPRDTVLFGPVNNGAMPTSFNVELEPLKLSTGN